MAQKKSFQGGTFETGGFNICPTSKNVNTPFKKLFQKSVNTKKNKMDVWKTYTHGFQMASLDVIFQGIFIAYILSYFDEQVSTYEIKWV